MRKSGRLGNGCGLGAGFVMTSLSSAFRTGMFTSGCFNSCKFQGMLGNALNSGTWSRTGPGSTASLSPTTPSRPTRSWTRWAT